MINLAAFFLYALNERRIRNGKNSISEKLKYTIAILGGGAGLLLARRIHARFERLPLLLTSAAVFLAFAGLVIGIAVFLPAGGSSGRDGGEAVAEETVQTETEELSLPEPAETESEAPESTEVSSSEESGTEYTTTVPERPKEESGSAETAESESAEPEESAVPAETESEPAERGETDEDSSGNGEESGDEESSAEESESVEPEPETITIVAIGDMLMHPGVSGLAFQPDGSVNYDFIFDPIREIIEDADIAALNNEVPFGGNEFGLQNYPNFNVFTELGDAEVKAGFDVVTYATNHALDQGRAGLYRTLDFWKKYPEMKVLGIHETPEDRDRLEIIEVKGIRIALLNYTYGSNAEYPYDQPYLLDRMETPEDRERIRADLQRAEEEADFTVVFPHWGEEYQLRESPKQDEWAAFFTECGADLIIGTHPHVLEPVRTIHAENGNSALCYFSLGNYISLQDETMSVLGGLANVTLTVEEDGSVRISAHETNYLVTHYDTNINYAVVYPLEQYTEELANQHGILVNHLPGNGLNEAYPFGISTLYRIIYEVLSY